MMEQAARLVARLAHRGQKYGDRSYLYHLDMVAQIVRFIGDISQDVKDEQWKDYLQMVETQQPLAFVIPMKTPGTYEPSLSKIGEAFNVGEESVLAPGVRGYAVEDGGLIKIPLIYAEKEGSGDVGRFLDSLSARCVIPSAFNPHLCGMLERRGFAPVWDGEVNVWRRDR